MPNASPRPCRSPGCGYLTTGTTYCPLHTKAVDKSYVRTGRPIYRTKTWKATRQKVLRENPWCVVPGCQNMATDVDHITPLRDGGSPYGVDNLQPLCRKHHSEKTMREVVHRK